MTVKTNLFGVLADIAESSAIEVEGVTTTNDLVREVQKKFPSFHRINFVVSVNRRVVSAGENISENDEIALLPPFSGG